MKTQIVVALGVTALVLAGCKTGEDLVLPNQSMGYNVQLAATSTSTGTSWICDTLDSNPTESGVEDLLLEAYKKGYRTDADAQRLLQAVGDGCPNYLGLIYQWSKNYGG